MFSKSGQQFRINIFFPAEDLFVDMSELNCFDMIEIIQSSSYYHLGYINKSENFQKLLRRRDRFDVIIVQVYVGDALLALGHHFDAPIIGVSPFGASKWTTDLTGAPNFASFVPHTISGYTDQMNFWQRMYNSLCYWYEDISMAVNYMPEQQLLLEDFFPNGSSMPTLDEIKKNISLVLLNTHVTLGTPRPYHPNMIDVGGLFIEQNIESLPGEIKTFLDGAKHGAIYIAFGSNIELARVPETDRNAILNAFSEYPKVRIIMRTNSNIEIPSHKQSDVFVAKWLPQQAILAHPNVKFYLTHGGEQSFNQKKKQKRKILNKINSEFVGLLSITEAVHFAKPMIGIPVYFDQGMNMKLVERRGFGINIPYGQLSNDKLKFAIGQLFTDSRYTENAIIASERFRDQIRTPMQTAIYWVKHVAKFKGAPHLRSPAIHMPYYIYYNVDCWAFIFFAFALSIFAFKFLCLRLFRKIFHKKVKKQKTN